MINDATYKVGLITLFVSVCACAQMPPEDIAETNSLAIAASETSQDQTSNMTSKPTKDMTVHNALEDDNIYGLRTPPQDILNGNGEKTGQITTSYRYTVYETRDGLSRIDPVKDYWVPTNTLFNIRTESPQLIKSVPSTGNNTVNLEEAIRKRENEGNN